jgi:plastocyanin
MDQLVLVEREGPIATVVLIDSREISAGKSWKYTPRRVGEYSYTCTLHPNMKGTLEVK